MSWMCFCLASDTESTEMVCFLYLYFSVGEPIRIPTPATSFQ